MRFFEALKETYQKFGFIAAWNLVFLPRVASRFSDNIHCSYNFRLRKYLKAGIQDIIAKYKEEPLLENSSQYANSVYSLWWQNKSELPTVVSVCRESIKNNLNGHSLILLDQNSYKNHITLPDYILRRVENKEISLSHLSDLIRLSLLVQYGGTWIDSCVFVLKALDNCENLNMPRFPCNDSANQGKWCFGVMSAPSGHKLMRFMLDSLLRYWEKHNTAIDYLMFDSFMMIAYEEFEDVRAEIDKFQITSPDLHRTRYLFDKVVDYSVFSSIIENNQFISLTWRIDYPYMTNGLETYYGALNRRLNEKIAKNNNP